MDIDGATEYVCLKIEWLKFLENLINLIIFSIINIFKILLKI